MFATRAVPPLGISTDKVCFVIVKAREFAAKDIVTEPDPGSNPSDDRMVSVLEDHRNDPTVRELTETIDSLSEDEQIDLVALMWLGRGDGTLQDWAQIRSDASDAHNERTAKYLLGTPLLADYLEEGLSLFGRSCEDFEMGRL
ncbi:MAG: DUF3775 domain-containing protein [Bradyrhizobiaceae bacterium]|nr:DUF3775 domain-containing protein [Bradyrhizobiaceae bacterium]